MSKQGTSTGYIFVTVELPGEAPRIVRWRGPSARAIRAAARARYGPSARLGFGAIVYINNYGAH